MKTNNIVDISKRTKGEYKYDQYLDIYAGYNCVSACNVGEIQFNEAEANAAFIVLACNNFDKLVYQLKYFIAAAETTFKETDYPFHVALPEAKKLLQSIEQQTM